MLHLRKMRALAAAVLAHALTDLLKGRDAAGVLAWINGRPARLPFSMACDWLNVCPRETRLKLREIAENPSVYCKPLKLVAFRTPVR